MMSRPVPRALLAVVAGVAPVPAAADQRLELKPSLVLGEVWDDNLFSSAEEPQADAITSFGPGLAAALRSRHFGASLSYSREADMFARRSSLNTTGAAQSAVGTLTYAGPGGLRLEAVQRYTTTLNPSQLVPTTGLDLGRRSASQVTSEESLSLPLGIRTRGSLRYTFAHDEIAGGLSGRTQSAGATLERRCSERSTVSLEYTLRHFEFGDDGVVSQVLLAGWTRFLGHRTSFRVAAGPRVASTDREPAPEVDTWLRHQFKDGELLAAYGRTEARILGLPGVGSTESATVSFTRSLSRALRFGLSPGVFRSRVAAADWTVYRVATQLTWSIGRAVSIAGAHQFAATRGAVPGNFSHNVFSVRLTVAPPDRPLVAADPPGKSGAAEEEP
jgi:hypothetical protein